MSAVNAFHELLRAFGTRKDPILPIWHVKTHSFWPFGKEQRNRQELVLRALRSLLGTGRLLLRTSEDPVDWEIPGSWSEVAPDTWRVPRELVLEDLSALLDPGGWCLYTADEPLPESIPNPWSPTAAVELHATLVDHRVDVFISSYADNTEWMVILPERAA